MIQNQVVIRQATPGDFEALYELGKNIPEFKVSATGEFMARDEFLSAIQNTNGTFLLAESGGTIVGFVYANRQDAERAPQTTWACLVYLVVAPSHRGQGVAQALYDACIQDPKRFGITKVYAWANAEGDGSIIGFMKKNGYAPGHQYLWMDREI